MTSRQITRSATPARNETARAGSWLAFSGPLIAWLFFSFAMAIYSALRAVCDSWFPVTDGRAIEEALFPVAPTIWLQDRLYGDWSAPLDKLGFLVHALWFPAPYVFGGIIMLRERSKLLEYLWWVLTASFVACLGFALLPTSPPWMDPEVARIMHERPLWTAFNYLEVDKNVVAAIPSLHAAIPMLIGLFCLLRTRTLHWLGWIAIGYSLVTGFFMVYMGEHWLVDILAGFALAGLVAAAFSSGLVFALIDLLPSQTGSRMAALNAAIFPEKAKVVPFRRREEAGSREAA